MMEWKKVKLGELFDFQKKSKTKAGDGFKTGNYPFFTSSSILSKYVNEYHFDKPSIIFGTGGTASIHYQDEPFAVSTDCYVVQVKANQKTCTKYVYHYLSGNIYILEEGFKGAGLKHISKEYLLEIEIPLPPLEKQQQIAHILDKADALRRKDRELLQQYDALAQAIFIEMFGDPVRNERGWKVGTIREMASEVKYGTSSPAESQGDYVYLRMNNITYGGEWDFKDLKYISVSSENKPKYVLKKHDLVFNRTNSKELVGKTAVYDQEQEMIIAGYLIRVRTNAYGNPYYISGFLNSKIGKSILFNMCKSIIGMANINAQELQNIQLQIPPIELQNEYQLRIEAIKGLKQNVLAAQQQSETLFQSLLQRNFRKVSF
jgi:type I restriction enzyme, S subunit